MQRAELRFAIVEVGDQFDVAVDVEEKYHDPDRQDLDIVNGSVNEGE